jgi:hypothetical protein
MSANFDEPLNSLAGSRFYAVTFILDHCDLQFDVSGGYHSLKVYVDPGIQVGDTWFQWGKPRFRDALCDQFGAHVLQTRTDLDGEQILIQFDNGARLSIPLGADNFVGPEAAEYFLDIGKNAPRPRGALWTEGWKDDWQRLYTAKQ